MQKVTENWKFFFIIIRRKNTKSNDLHWKKIFQFSRNFLPLSIYTKFKKILMDTLKVQEKQKIS
jgi:hypothetical protein